jgi:hypothetical protein
MSISKKLWLLIFSITACAAVWVLNRADPTESVAALHSEIEILREQNKELSTRIETLSQERQNPGSQAGAFEAKMPRLAQAPHSTHSQSEHGSTPQQNPRTKETGEGKTTTENETPFATAVLSLASRAADLNRFFVGMPEKEIPELQYLDEGDWLHLAKNAHLDSPEGVRKALADARQQAKVRFAPMLTSALAGFFNANNAQPPTSMDQLKPYFSVPVDDATLARYQITTDNTGKQKLGSATVISEAAAVDPQYDSHFEIGLAGWSAATVRDTYSERFK